jgi:hypothetical protein
MDSDDFKNVGEAFEKAREGALPEKDEGLIMRGQDDVLRGRDTRKTRQSMSISPQKMSTLISCTLVVHV